MLPSILNDKIYKQYKQLLTLFCLQHSKYKMAPPFEKTTKEVSSLSDENIIYPIIALTIVMLRLGCGVSIVVESGFFFIIILYCSMKKNKFSIFISRINWKHLKEYFHLTANIFESGPMPRLAGKQIPFGGTRLGFV